MGVHVLYNHYIEYLKSTVTYITLHTFTRINQSVVSVDRFSTYGLLRSTSPVQSSVVISVNLVHSRPRGSRGGLASVI